MIKKSLGLFVFVLMLVSVSAALNVTMSAINETRNTVSIVDANGLYAYEVNLAFTGDVFVDTYGGDFYDYLTHGNEFTAVKGTSEKGSIISVYESILDASSAGVSGSGNLFDIDYSGSLSLNHSILVFANGTEITINHVTGEVIPVVPDVPRNIGGGGGGTGGALFPPAVVNPIEISNDLLHVDMYPGDGALKKISLQNTQNSDIVVSDIRIEGLDDVLEISADEIVLGALSSQEVNLRFSIPADYEADVYTGRVLFVSSVYTAVMNVVLEVKDPDAALFDVEISFPQGAEFAPGENVIAEIEVFDYGKLDERFDFDLYYAIKDFEGTTLAFAEENIAIDTRVGLIRELQVPANTVIGDYIFMARASYEDAVASGSKTFRVVDVSFSPFAGSSLWIILGVALVVVIIVVVVIVIVLRDKT